MTIKLTDAERQLLMEAAFKHPTDLPNSRVKRVNVVVAYLKQTNPEAFVSGAFVALNRNTPDALETL